ncbi:hypothetical protein [Sphingobacterium daejeonense]|uniref:hypothetical protein n=1 Tax=Sphingobacterium daejeonense TaxID=371142 RepID=UPI0010C5A8AF|nr:hypothetical protein [Sphingobacterium daejeonense]VTP97690.1 Uncharacterised protein [Sphingobacterium daejeonense]
MENIKEKCQHLDQAEYKNLLNVYPQLSALLTKISDIATTQSLELLQTEIEKDEEYKWFDNSNWFNQIHGFSSSFIETEIDLYCEEQGKSKDELTELDYEDIALEIQSSIDCNCKELNEIIETIEE